jgi:hypothetical protein
MRLFRPRQEGEAEIQEIRPLEPRHSGLLREDDSYILRLAPAHAATAMANLAPRFPSVRRLVAAHGWHCRGMFFRILRDFLGRLK